MLNWWPLKPATWFYSSCSSQNVHQQPDNNYRLLSESFVLLGARKSDLTGTQTFSLFVALFSEAASPKSAQLWVKALQNFSNRLSLSLNPTLHMQMYSPSSHEIIHNLKRTASLKLINQTARVWNFPPESRLIHCIALRFPSFLWHFTLKHTIKREINTTAWGEPQRPSCHSCSEPL